MSNILDFPSPDKCASDRLVVMMGGSVSANDLAASLGSPDEWVSSAISYLKTECTSKFGGLEGMAIVSRAALQIVLAHLEDLEGRLGSIPNPKGAA